MKYKIKFGWMLFVVFTALIFSYKAPPQKQIPQKERTGADMLPSWNDGASKKSITDFVMKTTKEGGPDFVPVADRIACFDNDGTLWSEQPMYFQLAFAIDRIKAMAAQHPQWKTTQPFQALLEGI